MRNWKKALSATTSICLSVALASAFCVAAPVSAQADADASAAAASQGQADAAGSQEESSLSADYSMQSMASLLHAGQLSASSSVELAKNDAYDGVMVSGPANDLASQGIGVEREFDFGDGTVSRIRVQALMAQRTRASLACYLDGGSTPVATFKLKAQKKASSWDIGTKDYCVDISKLNLTGKHKVSFKVLDASSSNVQMLFKGFEFMKFTVPVVNFNIDEELGTVDAMNSSDNHSVECYGSIDVNVPAGYTSDYTGETLASQSYDLEYVRGRGNSTWGADTGHKPYKLKLEKSAGLLGMGKNKHWVLIANYYDNSQLRNKISYWLSEQLGFEYTVKLEPVEVVMNGEYYGSYYLCEQVRVGKNRLDIDDLEDSKDATDEETISGGYLLNLGEFTDPNQGFETNSGDVSTQWTIESPKFDGYFNAAQYNYIRNYIESTEAALFSDNFKDKSGKRYTDYLDIDSAVNYLWMQEFSHNGDAYVGGSNYLYKKRGGKLYFGPMWDFDYVAWGSTEYDKANTSGWQQKYGMWVPRLLNDKQFASLFVERWQTLKKALDELTASGGKLDQFASRIETAVDYNVEKWGMSPLAASDEEDDSAASTLTFKQEVERLRSWITQREAWVDANLHQLANPTKCTITLQVNGKTWRKQKAYVGDLFQLEGAAPEKAGYSFEGWKTSYSMSFEKYLTVTKQSEEEVIAEHGAKKVAKWKKNGYSFSGAVDEYTFNVPGNITLKAVFKPSSDSKLGQSVTKSGVVYEITGDTAAAGRSVRVAGLANCKAKKATVAKSIKVGGKSYAVTEIGARAFKGCKKLTTLKIKAPGAYVRSSTFAALPAKVTIKVPKAGLAHYRAMIHGRTVKSL